ncbi:hypothetical protein PL8927_110009 [Planktothrix serta PCC 8927]|uniref:Uncharacterized protein n=1 Tax=Planktothrix serta PCC 8927 TaxID=671068 RepID=A0A7Z9DVK6_9CYAN|nr:hypothetical protein PL8927_110009 [Planktothrix serta PCC 8927]
MQILPEMSCLALRIKLLSARGMAANYTTVWERIQADLESSDQRQNI